MISKNFLADASYEKEILKMDFFKNSQTNWKYILITVILAVLVGGGIFWYVAKQEVPLTGFPEIKKPKEIQIPNTPIIYSKEICDNYSCEDAIWMAHPATGIKIPIIKTTDEKITEGYKYYSIGSLALSSNKNLVAYTMEPQGCLEIPLRIFNLITGEDKLLTSIEGKVKGIKVSWCVEVSMNWVDSWSPNDKYLMIEWTRESEDYYFYKIINTNTGEEIITLKQPIYGDFIWLNDEELLYLSVHATIPREGKKPLDQTGIEAVNLKGEKRVLQEATELKNYDELKILKNGRVLFLLTEVKSPDDWDKENLTKTTYWTMNQEGEDLIQISEKEAMEFIKKPDIESLLSKELLSGYMKGPAVFNEKSFSENSDWWLFTMIRDVCPPEIARCFPPDDLFIINVKDETSLIKIDEDIAAFQGIDW